MNIAIIGSGRMGKAFAQILTEKHYAVVLGCRSPENPEIQQWAEKFDVRCISIHGAMQSADVIFLALPYEAALEQAKASIEIKSKIIVDLTNPVTSDLKEMVTGFSTSAGEQLQQLMPENHIVKAFNTIIAALVPQSARAPGEVQTLIAGDDPEAKQTVIALAKSLGFAPVDAGQLVVSRYIEPIAQMTIHLACFRGWGFTVSPVWKQVSPV